MMKLMRALQVARKLLNTGDIDDVTYTERMQAYRTIANFMATLTDVTKLIEGND